MQEPIYFFWTTQQKGLFAATHDESGKALPAHLRDGALIPALSIDQAGDLNDFPRADAEAEIEKNRYFLFHAKTKFANVKAVPK